MSAIPVIYALAATYLIIVFVPMVVYGIFAARFGLDQPEAKARFFAGMLIQKVGTAVGFVGLFQLGSEQLAEHWLAYSMVWVAMYGLTEIGQTFMSSYSPKEAVAGVISELIYFPFAGVAVAQVLG